MKIAQISSIWLRTPPVKYGGTEVVVSALTNQLVALGHDVTLFATGDSPTHAKLWSCYAVPVSNYSVPDEIVHVTRACEYIAQANFDMIHNHDYTYGPPLLGFSSTPHLTTFHGIPLETESRYYAAFSAKNRYVSISRRQRDVVPDLNWIGTVHNAIPVSEFPFGSQKEDYLLFIGNIAPWKGPHVAIGVAKALSRRLIIAGPISQSDYFEQEIAPHLDGELIVYVGEVDFAQKCALYQRASALLMPIDWEEAFGMVMIEALACGTPVVAFRRGAAPEIIKHGKVGFLVENQEEMIAAVRQVEKISAWRCREHVVARFDGQRMAMRYIELYHQVIAASA